MTARRNQSEDLPQGLKTSLEEMLSDFRRRISERACEIADQHSVSAAPTAAGGAEVESVRVSLRDLSQAVDELVQGQLLGPGLLARFFDLFPPFTCICTVLCIAFAALGLIAMINGTAGKIGPSTASGFLDIAKIFAGAIVGSTASIAIGAARVKRLRH
jgi:hypothetical protein